MGLRFLVFFVLILLALSCSSQSDSENLAQTVASSAISSLLSSSSSSSSSLVFLSNNLYGYSSSTTPELGTTLSSGITSTTEYGSAFTSTTTMPLQDRAIGFVEGNKMVISLIVGCYLLAVGLLRVLA